MRIPEMFAASMVAASLMVAPAAFAADPPKMDKTHKMDKMTGMNMDGFMKSCDMDHDGMMSKAEMLAHMEKMFDKMDTKKTGKLDRKQTQEFVKQFTAPSGG